MQFELSSTANYICIVSRIRTVLNAMAFGMQVKTLTILTYDSIIDQYPME